MFESLIEGFLLGIGLIVAIGAQNAFVLKQGLKRQHLFLTAFTCFICDSILIVLGVKGIGEFILDFPRFSNIMLWGGAAFLTWYGIRSFRSVFHPHVLVASVENPSQAGKMATFLALLGFTFLNPHTYIDTFLLLGTIGGDRPVPEHLPFMVGATTASLIWFFGLTYGASALSPIFRNPRAWQILDTIMGFVMIGIAIHLVISFQF
ncbi:MAG: LysE/ArgO family amino acid transporter [Candidatus Berkiellales bacterium]